MSQSLSDNLESKISNAIINGLLAILASLVRPLATLTEIFFRKEMGERYFSDWTRFGGVVAIYFCRWSFWDIGSTLQAVTNILAFAWFGALVYYAHLQRREMVERYKSGRRWHSYSCGVPRYEMIPVPVEKSIPIVLGLVMFFGFHLAGLGALLILSGGVSLYLRRHESQLFRSRLLDTIDSRIEQDNLNKALVEQLPPQQTEGFRAYLPSYFGKETRVNFVRARGGEQ